MIKCQIEGCADEAKRRGWCFIHYKRWWRHGDPTMVKKTPPKVITAFLMKASQWPDAQDCLPWPFSLNTGEYGQLARDKINRNASAVICEMVHGPAPTSDHEASHSCNYRACCNPHHLRWATAKENNGDKVTHGTLCRGESHPWARLNVCDVLNIRKLREENVEVSALMAFFNVSRGCIQAIEYRNTWSHVV